MALDRSQATAGGVSQPLPLPAGQAPPDEWVPLGSRRSAPETDPSRPQGAGAGGDRGRGGASWQLRVAPRHRAVVQRFFGDERKEGR